MRYDGFNGHQSALALVGFQCTPGDSPSISVTEGEVKVSVTGVDGGVIIENLSDVDCIVFVRSPEGEQRFELDVRESVTVTRVTKPIEVGVVGEMTTEADSRRQTVASKLDTLWLCTK